MRKLTHNIKQIATTGGGGRIESLLGWKGCRKSLDVEGLNWCAMLFCSVWGSFGDALTSVHTEKSRRRVWFYFSLVLFLHENTL